MTSYRLNLLPSLALIAVAAPAAHAQAISALKGHDRNAPVDVAADRIELQDRADRALLIGNVEVRQGRLTLAAERLTIAYSRAGATEIRRIDATGGVRVTSPSETARAQNAIYDLDRRIITMLGGVTLARDGNELRGARLVIDLDSGRATMDGAPVGGGSAGRVTGRFTVPKRN